MTARPPHIVLAFDIDTGTRELPPRQQIKGQQNGTAYAWIRAVEI